MTHTLNQTQVIYTNIEPNHEYINNLVGGYFTSISLGNNKIMYMNEDGETIKLPINDEASSIVGYTIYGNVLIC
jgi:hypothetical protein